MKKLIKKFISTILVAVLMLTMAPLSGFVGFELPDLFKLSASAATYSGTCGDNLIWNYDESTGELSITGTGAMYDYDYNNRPWESYEDNINSVVICNSVTTIGNYAFYDCDSLTSVTIGNSVTTIENFVFSSCDSLTSIAIPDSVTTIGDSAFRYCDSLTSITIPDSVTTIGAVAFSDCDSLTSVTIGNSVTTIGYGAFEDCDNLTSITIPDSVTTIGDWAFEYCAGLTNITVDTDNQYYSSDSYGVLYNKDKTELIQYPIGNERTSFTIPDSVTTIGDYAFSDCDSLTSVTIPDSVTSIGNYAFYNCTNLTSVTIGNAVTSIGYSAFNGCTSLIEVYYQGTEEEWNQITIGSENDSLLDATIDFREDIANGTCGDDLVWTLYNDGELVISGTGAMTNYSSDSSVPWKSYRSSIKSVSLPGGLTSIGSNAFSDCTGLTSVTIPDSVTSIEDFAFYDCTDITSVTIGNGVKSIGFVAFNGCTGLTNITIPDSVTSIDASAFAECTSLARFTINSGNQFYSSDSYGVMFNKNKTELIQYPIGNSRTSYLIPDGVTIIGYEAFANCSNLTSVAIPDSVTSIAQYAFYGCTDITSITIPNSVTRINNGVFRYCESLVSVTIPDSVTDIGNQAFYSCTSLTSVTIPDSVTGIGDHAFFSCTSLTNITIPDSVTSIGDDAFWDCSNLLSVAIGKSVTAIGDCAFDYCSKLIGAYYHGTEDDWSKIDIGENNENLIENVVFIDPEKEIIDSGECGEKLIWYLYEDGELVIIGTGKMENYLSSSSVPWYSYCSNIKSVSLPDGLTSIGQYAFWDCTGLTSVTIPDSVTSVGERAFTGCTGLTSIIIPNSVTSIGYSTFSDCTGLTSVIIGNNVTSIGNRAFSGCTSLTNITIPDSVTSIDQSAFYNCKGLTNITIPDSVTSIGSRAFWDCTGLTSVTIGNSVTSIGSDAFMGCTSLENVYYTGDIAGWCSITYSSIDSNPMYCADNLYINGELLQGGIVIPNSVTSIGEYSFYNCTGLTSVTIPNSVTSIGEYSFYNCTGLTSVTIPDSVTNIENYAFHGCDNLTDVYFQGSKEDWNGISVGSWNKPLLKATIHFPHTHSYTSAVTTPATCTTDGVMTYTCDCGDSYTEVIVKTGHSLTPVTVPSTCTVNGMEYDMCFDCGETFNVTVLPLANHNYIDEVIEATCTSHGYTKHSCESCDSEYTDNYVDSTGHSYGSWIEVTPATCTENGSRYKQCSICSHRYEETVSKLGHIYIDAVVAPTCTSQGYTKHSCERCDSEYIDSYIDATGHTYVEQIVKQPTCTAAGKKQFVCHCGDSYTENIKASGHKLVLNRKAPTCSEDGFEIYTCSVCALELQKTTLPATGEHNLTLIRQEATCENFGMEYSVCDDCGNVIGDTIILPATGHSYGEWIISVPATCTEDGLRYKECVACSYKVEETVSKTGHNVSVVRQDPTCENFGMEYNLCNDCGNIIGDTVILPATGHNYGEWIVSTPATCTEDGLLYKECAGCSDRIEETIPKYEHSYQETVVNPTCTEQGYTKHICERCDHEYVDCYIDSIGHNYGNWQVVTNPTTTSTGLMVRKCSNCDDSIEMSIPELIPNYVTSVELSLDKLVLSLHETATLTATVKPDTAIITGVIWSSSNPDIVSVDNGVLTAKRPGTSIVTVKTVDGDFEDYCFVRVNGLKSVAGTYTVIDNESSTIYGISANLQSLDGYVDVLDENMNLAFDTETLGTGTTVSLQDSGEQLDSYTVVIFGDVNGDGWYDGQDAVLVSCLANGMLTKDDVSEAVYTAADCNHDGVIDESDVALLNQAGTLLANVDQTKPTEVLLETSSEYIEYLDIIDQSPEIEIEDETDVESNFPESGDTEDEVTPTDDTEDSTQQGSAKIDIFEMIITFIKSIFEMLLSYIPVPIK